MPLEIDLAMMLLGFFVLNSTEYDIYHAQNS